MARTLYRLEDKQYMWTHTSSVCHVYSVITVYIYTYLKICNYCSTYTTVVTNGKAYHNTTGIIEYIPAQVSLYV